MTTRLVIQHLTGSKANQIEQFQMDRVDELTLGRDPGCTVVFDANRDDAVSRRHATIKITQGERPSFAIADLGSSNGTLVNGTRISSETELLPGDTVQLGLIGPSFVFDVQPRPPHLMGRTRVVQDRPAATTRMDSTVSPEPVAATTTFAPPPTMKSGVGRETVERMLSAERQATGQKWMYALAGVVAVIGVVGGTLYWRMTVEKERTAAQIEERARAVEEANNAALEDQKRRFTEEKAKADADLKKQLGISPSEVLAKNGDATVFVSMQWRLFDRTTGKPLFHKTWLLNGELLPAYIKLQDGSIVRWLTTEDSDHANKEVGAAGTGTGFVINDDGYILTNKHVAAGWMINYNQFSPYETGKGVLFALQTDPKKKPDGMPIDVRSRSSEFRDLISWTPDAGGMIFDSRLPIRVGESTRQFEGRNEEMNVRFPGSRNSITAQFLRASGDADVALIKVDSPERLGHVEMAADDVVTTGGAITVLGYPGDSVKTYASHTTIEAGEVHRRLDIVPEPTVTPGSIARLSVGEEQRGAITVVGPMGDLYQLNAAVGAGNSGGPVFDAAGKVIGIFTYGTLRESMTLAVPIRYGRDLIQVQRKY